MKRNSKGDLPPERLLSEQVIGGYVQNTFAQKLTFFVYGSPLPMKKCFALLFKDVSPPCKLHT